MIRDLYNWATRFIFRQGNNLKCRAHCHTPVEGDARLQGRVEAGLCRVEERRRKRRGEPEARDDPSSLFPPPLTISDPTTCLELPLPFLPICDLRQLSARSRYTYDDLSPPNGRALPLRLSSVRRRSRPLRIGINAKAAAPIRLDVRYPKLPHPHLSLYSRRFRRTPHNIYTPDALP